MLDFPPGEREMKLYFKNHLCVYVLSKSVVSCEVEMEKNPQRDFGGKRIRNFFSNWM